MPVPGDGRIASAPGILDPIGVLLEDEGYRVSVALAPLAPDVIVQELLFRGRPEADWAALIQMQLTPELAGIPVILCTTASDLVAEPTMAANLDRLGIRVVLKPFLLEDLVTAVADVLTARRLIEQLHLIHGEEPALSSSPGGTGLSDSRTAN